MTAPVGEWCHIATQVFAIDKLVAKYRSGHPGRASHVFENTIYCTGIIEATKSVRIAQCLPTQAFVIVLHSDCEQRIAPQSAAHYPRQVCSNRCLCGCACASALRVHALNDTQAEYQDNLQCCLHGGGTLYVRLPELALPG